MPLIQRPCRAEPFYRACVFKWESLTAKFSGGIVGVNHNFTPAEAQEFADTMRAIQKPTGHKITRNREEGTSTIEFRPRHGLVDIHCLGLFFEQKLGFAGYVVGVNQKDPFLRSNQYKLNQYLNNPSYLQVVFQTELIF